MSSQYADGNAGLEIKVLLYLVEAYAVDKPHDGVSPPHTFHLPPTAQRAIFLPIFIQ